MTEAGGAGVGDLAIDLETIVGSANVVSDVAALHGYRTDATFLVGRPALAVRPASTEEVARVVARCAADRMPIVPRGAGTGLSGGAVPLDGGVVLDLGRLTGLEIDPPNLCAVAGAGVITGAIDAAAAARGFMYPPDPASVDLSTIGGNVATNAGGMRCLKYGVTADYVIGLTVVLADGGVLHLGGRLRKRAAGYRLIQLFVGSEGTLGVVTEVIVRLVPRPRHRATALVGFVNLGAAADGIARLLRAGYLPVALELLDHETLELVADHLPAGFDPDLGAALIVEQDGAESAAVARELSRMTELLGAPDVRIAGSEVERDGLWAARRRVGTVLHEMSRHKLSQDVAVPIAAIPAFVRGVQQLGTESGLQILLFGHAGDGNVHTAIVFEEADRARVALAARRIMDEALALGGTISAEHGLGVLKRDHAVLEQEPGVLALSTALKRTLDPAGILNPHKVLPERSVAAPLDDAFLDALPGWLTPVD